MTLLFLLVAFVVFNFIFNWVPMPWDAIKPEPPEPAVVPKSSVTKKIPSVIDYEKIKDESDPELGAIIAVRKDRFGLKDSVDMVVSSDESIRVGDSTVSFSEILKAIEQETGNRQDGPESTESGEAIVTETDLTEEAGDQGHIVRKKITAPIRYYGVKVVKRGDTLWDIHFAILREYLAYRGIDVAPDADQKTLNGGRAPGVARILKWAESMVHIYNVKSHSLDKNLNVLAIKEKVVVINLTRMDNRLSNLDPADIDQVRFIGDELYLHGPPDGDNH